MVEAPDRVHTFALCSLQVMRCSLVLMRKRKTTNPVALADEAGVVFLPDGHRAGAALLVDDGRRHHHVQVPGHRDHGVRVHLQQGVSKNSLTVSWQPGTCSSRGPRRPRLESAASTCGGCRAGC